MTKNERKALGITSQLEVKKIKALSDAVVISEIKISIQDKADKSESAKFRLQERDIHRIDVSLNASHSILGKMSSKS